MQQDNKTQNQLKTGTIHEYFDRNILTLTMSNPLKRMQLIMKCMQL